MRSHIMPGPHGKRSGLLGLAGGALFFCMVAGTLGAAWAFSFGVAAIVLFVVALADGRRKRRDPRAVLDEIDREQQDVGKPR